MRGFAEVAKIVQMMSREAGVVGAVPGLPGMEFVRVEYPGGPFYISDTPVNEAAWWSVVANGVGALFSQLVCHAMHYSKTPKVNVSHEDILRFLTHFNSVNSSLRISLPTESQWMAAKGDFPDPSKGHEQLGPYVWYSKTLMTYSSRRQKVRQKCPNSNGLYDMIGNVWEWTSTLSQYDKWSYVILGGSWRSSTDTCMRDYRRTQDYDISDNRTGFRLILEVSK